MTRLVAFFGGLWARVAPYAMAATAVVAGIGALLYAGRRQGRMEAENAALRGNAADRRVRDEEDLQAARHDDPIGELRRRWSRD